MKDKETSKENFSKNPDTGQNNHSKRNPVNVDFYQGDRVYTWWQREVCVPLFPPKP